MLLTIIQLVVSLLAILGAAIVFTNAVEIMGERLELGGGAVGTAPPETMIPLVAIIVSIITGSGATNEVVR